MTYTNLDSYVNGLKVVSSTHSTVTLKNGVTIDKAKCRYISVDTLAGATYYRYDDEDLTGANPAPLEDLFSVYLFDPEHGWRSVDHLTLNQAITHAEDWRSNWAGSRVALVPHDMEPEPFMEFALAIA